jgi:tripartite-type tricarboxylate transporter receptor subunit TctC
VLNRRQFTAAGLAALAATPARAQTWPDRPIRILAGYPAGGGIDLVARLFAEQMKTAFNQTVIVENRPGASAMIASNAVAKAAPDGLTLLMAASGEVAINQHIHKDRMTYDPARELSPVALVGIVPCVVVVAAATPVKDGRELIAYARANKGKLSFSSSGIGNPQQLAGELMNHMAGTDVLHVPYRGGGALVPDLLSGSITGAMTEVSTALPHLGGKVRILAVASAKRAPKAPDSPTMIEQGVKDFTAASYVGILAPTGTPAEVVKALEAALIKALNDKGTQEKFLATGAELVPDELMTSKGFGDYIRREYELAREAAKLAGLTPA